MYQNLYRKYRPDSFDEVTGQQHIIKTLKNSIKENKISHAYLFTGPRGTGKTSIAKILSKTINCENLVNSTPCNKCVSCTQLNNKQSIDILEIDAASNNGVDEIRELNSKVNLVPSTGKYKVYIIDEVHMLTTGAFNALLKTLEEPPAHIIFILATTEPHKIPMTILSRCQRFDFKKLTNQEIINRLNFVVSEEKINIDDEALLEIAQLSDGGMRDSLGLLDQVTAYADDKVTIDDVHEVNGTITKNDIDIVIKNIIKKDIIEILKKIDTFDQKGKDFVKLIDEIIYFLRNIMIAKTVPNYAKNIGLDDIFFETAKDIEISKIIWLINKFNMLISIMKVSNNPKMSLEILIIEICSYKDEKIENLPTINSEKEESNLNINKSNNNIEETIFIDKKIEQLKNIRINNALCNIDKKVVLEIKNKIKELTYIMLDPDYCESYSMIMDGEIKIFGNDIIIFVFESSRISDEFNSKVNLIDKLLVDKVNSKYKAISTYKSEWDQIKKEFNSKTKKYDYIEEPKNIFVSEKNNKLEELFDDIIEYVKE